MKPQVRRLRLRKSTLREVTSALAHEVVGGSEQFTEGCTYTCNCTQECHTKPFENTCQQTCVISIYCDPTEVC